MTGEPVPPEPGAPPPTESYPFWTYTDLLVLLGITVPCILLSLALVQGVLHVLHAQSSLPAVKAIAQQFTLYLLLFLALMAMLRLQYDRPFWHSLAWTETRIPPAFLIALGLALSIAVSLLGWLIRTPTTENPMMELLKDRASIILVTIFGFTAGPLCEEVIFRGFLQPLLVRSLG